MGARCRERSVEDRVSRRAVFLDRDGVLNRAVVREGLPYPPSNADAVEILPGVHEGLCRLHAAGFALIVVSNQPDVARGITRMETVEAINAVLAAALPIDRFIMCVHDDQDACRCRKPRPGMLLDGAAALGIDLGTSFMIGDRWRDIEGGRAAGCTTIFLDYGYAERRPAHPDHVVASMDDAVAIILRSDATPHSSSNGSTVDSIASLSVKIFADGADLPGMLAMYAKPYIKGLTTNPTLMRKAGLTDYRKFANEVLAAIPDRPISFEVFADDLAEMERQALEITGWGEHVYVKIPVTNTQRESTHALVARLVSRKVKVNVTAIMTMDQVRQVSAALDPSVPSYVSVFAGRIADTGRDPVPFMAQAVELLRGNPNAELIWASPRELLNIFQADQIGCHVITVTHDLLKKLTLVGYDLAEYSLDTVKMFRDDALASGFHL